MSSKDNNTPLHDHSRSGYFERIRRHFVAGILVILPVVVATWAVFLIMGVADRIFGPFVREILENLGFSRFDARGFRDIIEAIISFLLAIIFITSIGWLSTFFLIRRLIAFGERIVTMVPIIKFFYQTPKEVINTLTMTKGTFKRVVMIEYPRKGIFCLAFATGDTRRMPDQTNLIAVFLPTTPNPTSGFLLLVPVEDVRDTNIPVEEGVRLIISGGILSPKEIHTTGFKGFGEEPELPPLGPLTAEEHIANEEEAKKVGQAVNNLKNEAEDKREKP